jgi:hypothetical protein
LQAPAGIRGLARRLSADGSAGTHRLQWLGQGVQVFRLRQHQHQHQHRRRRAPSGGQ